MLQLVHCNLRSCNILLQGMGSEVARIAELGSSKFVDEDGSLACRGHFGAPLPCICHPLYLVCVGCCNKAT